MVKGDFLVLFVGALFFYMPVSFIHNYLAYKKDQSTKLSDNDILKVNTIYKVSIFVSLIGLIPFFLYPRDPFYLNKCNGVGRCIEAHTLSFWISGASFFVCGLTMFVFGGKKKKEIDIRENKKKNSQLL